ncbi:MAG TPA: hypothetical protein VEJ39_00195, partial [Candidatus Acidoferrales bacterium]|nr:hypothetical protein [Candidatus Acidoferrales bacterium]
MARQPISSVSCRFPRAHTTIEPIYNSILNCGECVKLSLGAIPDTTVLMARERDLLARITAAVPMDRADAGRLGLR